jgi:hypothetical protein
VTIATALNVTPGNRLRGVPRGVRPQRGVRAAADRSAVACSTGEQRLVFLEDAVHATLEVCAVTSLSLALTLRLGGSHAEEHDYRQ